MTKKELSKMKKDDLIDLAEEQGVEIEEGANKADIVEAMWSHYSKDDEDKSGEPDKNPKKVDKDPQAPQTDFASEYKKKKGKMVKVKAIKCMSLIDGNHLVPGEVCEITEAEKKHLDADKRGIKFYEAV